MVSDARPVIGRPNSTSSAVKAVRPSDRRPEWVGEGGRRRRRERETKLVSKGGEDGKFHE